MNLADAIRNAAIESGSIAATATYPERSRPFEEPKAVEPAPAKELPAKPATKCAPQENPMPETPAPFNNNQPAGNLVRLELVLTAEQIALLFKSIVTGQHTIMTLREAAAHLRIPAHALETMASEGEVPAFLLDGRWRFSRVAVDEWLQLQQPERKDQEAA